MPNYVYIAASLDGFIARENGGIDWLTEIPNPDGGDFGFSKFMENIDAIVMGRNTFETVLTFGEWPYSKPVFVYSTKLKELPGQIKGKGEIVQGAPNEVVSLLNSRGFKNLYIDGGITIQSFLNAGLIDELIITRIPVLLGRGIPLFGEAHNEQKFIHRRTEILNDMLVKSHYIRIK